MQRRIAIFLLLVALIGTITPVAVAATTAPPHACCIRHAHHCHDSAGSSSDLTIHGAGCCSHDCCRAVTTSQKAHPGPALSLTFAQQIDVHVAESPASSPALQLSAFQSPRAPPHTLLA